MKEPGTYRINYWTHTDVLCLWCDGEGVCVDAGKICSSCQGTGWEPVPWTELFSYLRRDTV